jgi:hexosaminidase
VGRYPGTASDETEYGGFYSKSDVKAIVAYAADRHITVIPEIEMPGHASAAIAAYPELSCFPDQKTDIPNHASRRSVRAQASGTAKLVQETWGVFNDVFCAGKEETFTFLEGVLDEVTALFPSRYIHVGGDESPKVHWKRCPRCQQRMKDEGLKDEHELQSYFVQRIERYLGKKGKTIIGWDEILEGGLAPNAVVMSWQGEKGGVVAARQKHNVIMTPQVPVYFDHTQTKHEDSLTIGGFNPLEKVYAYEPVPAELTSSEAQYILGAQANLWTEYITNGSKVEYMILPRMSALSEVLWSPKASRDFASFEKRLQIQFNRYALWNAHASRAYFDLATNIGPQKGKAGVSWSLKTRSPGAQIVVTLPSGATRALVGDSVEIPIDVAGTYTAWAAKRVGVKAGSIVSSAPRVSKTIQQQFSISKATGKRVAITSQPNQKYPGQNGAFSLVNGVWSNKGLSAPDWLAWIGEDIEAVIDLGKPENITNIRLHTIDQKASWVYLPKWVEVALSSDGKSFSPAGRSTSFVVDSLSSGWISVAFPAKSARYIKVVARNYGLIPDGQPGAGNKAWIFTDEIEVL